MANAIELTEATPEKRREILEQSFGGNLPGGPLLLDEDSRVDAVVSVRGGTAAVLDEIVLKDRELAIEEDGDGLPVGLRAGDGETAGGKGILGQNVEIIEKGTAQTVTEGTDDATLTKVLSEGVYQVDLYALIFSTGGGSGITVSCPGGNLRILSPLKAVGEAVSDVGTGLVSLDGDTFTTIVENTAFGGSTANFDIYSGAFLITVASSATVNVLWGPNPATGGNDASMQAQSALFIRRLQ